MESTSQATTTNTLIPSQQSAVTIAPRGMKNLDNTCYALSALQVLNNVEEIRKIIFNVKTPIKGGSVEMVKQVFKALNGGFKSTYDPKKLREYCLSKGYAVDEIYHGHHDASEFYEQVVLNLARENDDISDLAVILHKIFVCESCGTSELKIESTHFLLMSNYTDINTNLGIEAAMARQFGERMIPCCEKMQIDYSFGNTPSFIAVLIDRVDGNMQVNTENRFKVDENIEVQTMVGFQRYTLTGVILHEGFHALRGHYVSCIRRSLNDRWFRVDDSKVIAKSGDEVFRHISVDSPRLLIYTKNGIS